MIDANINHVQTNLDFTSHQITINIEAQYPPQCKRLKHHLVLEALADWIRQSPKSLPCLVSVTCAKLDGLGATVGGPSPSPSPASSSSPPSSPPASAPASPPASPPAQGHHPHHHHHHHHSIMVVRYLCNVFPEAALYVNSGELRRPSITCHLQPSSSPMQLSVYQRLQSEPSAAAGRCPGPSACSFPVSFHPENEARLKRHDGPK